MDPNYTIRPDSRRFRQAFMAGLLTAAGASALGGDGVVSPLAAPGAGTGRARSDAEVEQILKLPHTEVENVRLVLLPASVEDRRGRVVRGLSREDFRLFEDQVPQEIRYFSVENREPVEVAFLLDVSGSMREVGKLEEAKEAVGYFVRRLRPTDRFALICFADEQVAWVTPFTSEVDTFVKRLSVQEGYGQTALHDAVAAAPGLVQEAEPGRKAIILITDGVDNASRLSPEAAIAHARTAEVPIYTIGLSSLPAAAAPKDGVETNLRTLDLFSQETGGLMFAVRDPDDLKEAIARIEEELRFQYLIGYSPKHEAWDGRFRRVRLEARKRGLEVRTRTGYYANP